MRIYAFLCIAFLLLMLTGTLVADQIILGLSGGALVIGLMAQLKDTRGSTIQQMMREGATPRKLFFTPAAIVGLRAGIAALLFLHASELAAAFELAGIPLALHFRRCFCDYYSLAHSVAHHARHTPGN